MQKILILLILCILASPVVLAERGQLTLLTVSDSEDLEIGGTADLFLEIKPGTGRVFLETFPLSKVDTQISTRFAQQVACDFADVDCRQFDFFYTIIAPTSIVAGPSAGAAVGVLTFSLLTGEKLDEKTVITGTMNAGGIIGPVGGIRAKIAAAEQAGFEKVLIPFMDTLHGSNMSFQSRVINITNGNISFGELTEQHDIDIVEVPTLNDALFEFTGTRFKTYQEDVAATSEYEDHMKDLAIQLCARSTQLSNRAANLTDLNESDSLYKRATNLSARGRQAFQDDTFYSSASFCFGSNVQFNLFLLEQKNVSKEEIDALIEVGNLERNQFEAEVDDRELLTIADLETYMVVKERLLEAQQQFDLAAQANTTEDALFNVAFGTERLQSAYAWYGFLQNEGRTFEFTREDIARACRQKLSEAEERLQYVNLYFPESIQDTRESLDVAYTDLRNENYELCLFRSSKAKADTDTLLSVFGVSTPNVGSIVSKKLEVASQTINEQTANGVFPLVGYSYYEYANSLLDSDPFSSLVYASYALELSRLDIYFEQRTESGFRIPTLSPVGYIMFGVLIGIILTAFMHVFAAKTVRRKHNLHHKK